MYRSRISGAIQGKEWHSSLHFGVVAVGQLTELIYTHTQRVLLIYSISQKWVHPSHFCRYLSISLHGTTLTKWHLDTMKSSLCAAYITELIYFPLKITQNIAIKSFCDTLYIWSNRQFYAFWNSHKGYQN